MTRKQFIESQGATCRNWRWSWSFINEKEKIIIFGAWDNFTNGTTATILSENWQISRKRKKQPAYGQSREHIRLIEEEGYKLKIFIMKYSRSNEDENNTGPAKIAGFDRKLIEKSLNRQRNNGKIEWYAI